MKPPRLSTIAILGLMLTFLACSGTQTVTSAVATATTESATATIPATATPTLIPPTPTPPTCPARFGTTAVTTIPNTSFSATNVYSTIPLPPQTFFAESDAAGGERGKTFCSGGTIADIQTFMTNHLTALGWTAGGQELGCDWAGNAFANPQCWKNGTYTFFLGINSATEWIILFRDPDFHA
jgi:hypothetical protein